MSNVEDLPRNYVMAVVGGSDSAANAVSELQRAGFPETLVFEGDQLAEQLGGQGNFLSNALKSIADHLSEESDYLSQYLEEAQSGGSIIAVKTGDRQKAHEVWDILQPLGARNARFFGSLMVTDLSMLSNPSATEDVTQAPTA